MVRYSLIIFIICILPVSFYTDNISDFPEQNYDENTPYERQIEHPDNLYMAFIRTFLSLILVLALLFIFLYFLQKYYQKGFYSKFKKNKNLMVYDSVSISRDKHICIIKCYDRQFLIGITQNNINLISELFDESVEDFDEEN